jgi:hypothetical protein
MIVKANYVKRGEGDRARAKATIRYITHRRDREGERVTRDLFGFEGMLTKQTAYRLIDEAPQKGRYYYRMILSPDPRREDRYRDLDLKALTRATMLNRHVHTLVILNGRRLTRADFASLRSHARNRALTQRRFRDRVRRLEYLAERSSSYRPPFPFQRRDIRQGRFYRQPRPLESYTCPLCGEYRALPYSRQGYRCLADGVLLRRDKPYALHRELPTRRIFNKERSRELALELS